MNDTEPVPISEWRSMLFVPGNDYARLAKAPNYQADAVIVDLEDAVPAAAKSKARCALPDTISMLAGSSVAVTVRVNAGWRELAADLAVAVRPGVSALIIPKVECAYSLGVVSEMIAEWEEENGLQTGTIRIIALVESPTGLAAAGHIARAPRVAALALGTEDFALAMGVAPTRDLLDLPCRQLALAAAGAGIASFAMPLSIAEFRSMEAMTEAARTARRYGMSGALCIHPAQVALVNAVFQPDESEIAEANAVVAAWFAAEASGSGIVSLKGKMIDLPVVARSQRILARVVPNGTPANSTG